MAPKNVCYLCGYQGAAESVQTLGGSKQRAPFYPWLRTAPMACEASPPNINGELLLCRLCSILLQEQWKMHESKRTPIQGRQYWVKSDCSDLVSDDFSFTSSAPSVENTKLSNRSCASATNSSPSASPSPQFDSKMIINCVLCCQKLTFGPGTYQLLDSEILRRIPQYAVLDAKLAGGQAIACRNCFENPAFKSVYLDALLNYSKNQVFPSNTAGVSNQGFGNAALVYQFLLQQLSTMHSVNQESAGTSLDSFNLPHGLNSLETLAALSSRIQAENAASTNISLSSVRNDLASKPASEIENGITESALKRDIP